MKHCETCQFWGKPDEAAEEFRSCTAVIHDQDDLTCRDQDFEQNQAGEWVEVYRLKAGATDFMAAHKAVVCDGSGYRAALKPRRDFGCVLHEPGDRPTP